MLELMRINNRKLTLKTFFIFINALQGNLLSLKKKKIEVKNPLKINFIYNKFMKLAYISDRWFDLFYLCFINKKITKLNTMTFLPFLTVHN